MKNCVDCGHCGHGCPYDAKQSMLTALMHPLVDDGKLNVLANCFVQKIITKVVNGKKKVIWLFFMIIMELLYFYRLRPLELNVKLMTN